MVSWGSPDLEYGESRAVEVFHSLARLLEKMSHFSQNQWLTIAVVYTNSKNLSIINWTLALNFKSFYKWRISRMYDGQDKIIPSSFCLLSSIFCLLLTLSVRHSFRAHLPELSEISETSIQEY